MLWIRVPSTGWKTILYSYISNEYHDWNNCYRIALLIFYVVCCVGFRFIYSKRKLFSRKNKIYISVYGVFGRPWTSIHKIAKKKQTLFSSPIHCRQFSRILFSFSVFACLSVWPTWRTPDWRLTIFWFEFCFFLCWMKNNATRSAFHSLSGNAFCCAQPNFITA